MMDRWSPHTVCACRHRKGQHWLTKDTPQAPCRECACTAFTPEPVCVCGHGKKAHARGPCHHKYLCGCTAFREEVARG
jgi:hypothetical protein